MVAQSLESIDIESYYLQDVENTIETVDVTYDLDMQFFKDVAAQIGGEPTSEETHNKIYDDYFGFQRQCIALRKLRLIFCRILVMMVTENSRAYDFNENTKKGNFC
ncbi:hypothetical protein DMUE_3752 [Dictyocoela muelleri]|nr:hypothetical protein DMUE_3752 [Dictyocoela muelleri]